MTKTRRDSGASTPCSRAKLVAVNALVTCLIFFVCDFAVSGTNLIYGLVPNSFRMHDTRLHHKLAPDVSDGVATWGPIRYPFFTNSLGYRDASARRIARHSDKPVRVMFMGDSFTEGVGMPWEKSFVGLFAARFPDVDVLDGAVVSYDSSMYWKKTKALLDAGYEIDHVVVYPDVSDVQDQAMYRYDGEGNIVDSDLAIDTRALVGDPPQRIERRKPSVAGSTIARWLKQIHIQLSEHFVLSKYLAIQLNTFFRRASPVPGAHAAVPPASRTWGPIPAILGDLRACRANVLCLVRGLWTIDGLKMIAGYGERGVEGNIAAQMRDMDALASLLRSRRIGLSVGVYPWPDQLRFDTAESRQVRLWHDWCRHRRCEAFIDHFADFFRIRASRSDWLDALYIAGDYHFNEAGNRLIADGLIAAAKPIVRPRKRVD